MKLISSLIKCPNCGSTDVTRDTGQAYCCKYCDSTFNVFLSDETNSAGSPSSASDIWRCHGCGLLNETGSPHCGACGSTLVEKCLSCNMDKRNILQFCPHCGERTEDVIEEHYDNLLGVAFCIEDILEDTDLSDGFPFLDSCIDERHYRPEERRVFDINCALAGASEISKLRSSYRDLEPIVGRMETLLLVGTTYSKLQKIRKEAGEIRSEIDDSDAECMSNIERQKRSAFRPNEDKESIGAIIVGGIFGGVVFAIGTCAVTNGSHSMEGGVLGFLLFSSWRIYGLYKSKLGFDNMSSLKIVETKENHEDQKRELFQALEETERDLSVVSEEYLEKVREFSKLDIPTDIRDTLEETNRNNSG